MGIIQFLAEKVSEQGPVGKTAIVAVLVALGIAAPYALLVVGLLVIASWAYEIR